ncbi:MAG: hypothetical protein MK105_19040 [Crocinitomicaceae bacterium]|nr:hypothetical protein [Crocinitomicaceae bacterium]
MPLLLDKISSVSSLKNAWKKLHKGNINSHGVSDITIAKFKENLDENLELLSKKLTDKKFKFSPNRAVAIQKSKGGYRPLQIPEIKDRVVLKALAIELEEQFRSIIFDSLGISFAYQKNTGVRDAVECMVRHYNDGYPIILEADIVNFFGEVNKQDLLENKVFSVLPDDSLNELITAGLNQSISGVSDLRPEQAKAFENIGEGIPQGNPLSPLLSNVFLSPFDQFMKSKGYRMVRYADDFVVLCKDKKQAEICFDDSSNFLRNTLNLKLYDLTSEKSSITDPKKSEFVFLSIQFDGQMLFPSLSSVRRLKSKMLSVCQMRNINAVILLTKVQNRLDGWVSSFFYTDVDRYAEEIDFYVDRQLFLALSKFEWKFKDRGVLPSKYRTGTSSDCLTKKQRRFSGVSEVKTLLEGKRNEADKENEEAVENIAIEQLEYVQISNENITNEEIKKTTGIWATIKQWFT